MPKTKVTKAEEPKTDITQIAKDLVAKAKKTGKIEQRDITAAIPETPENAEVLDKLYTELADASVVVGSAVAGTEEETPELSDEWSLEDGEEVVVEDQRYLDDIADDS